MKPHSFTLKCCGFQYCAHCGLVMLKNEATQRAIRNGCKGKD